MEDEKQEEVVKELNTMKAAAGILLADWQKKETQKENQMFRLMMQNKTLKEAYAKQNNCTVEDLNSNFELDDMRIPDSVFTNDMDDEEAYRNALNENFSFNNFDNVR
jgi:hypothetical protein